ncbi:hypothetical protein [Caedibacter taeniospiralis]|uniref:hypothetical protein n=1 Tax=Caedibacter taeniospiralis TaxID=28907 RepID=UPI00130240A5|nr:hypothetical protein [Caedibacter taeniospiralis]
MELARAEGIETGIEKGILKGKFEVAKNLKQLGLTDEQISKATGLSVDELKQLK